VSFDPREKPELANGKKSSYVQSYRRAGSEKGWRFLTGDEASIKKLTDSVGFRYTWDAKLEQFAHAAAIMVLTPEGKISRYLYGIDYAPRDLKLGLVEASENKIGGPVEQLLLYCFHYNPLTGRYGAATINLVRAGGVLTIFALAGFMFIMFRRDWRQRRLAEGRAA
jgi:protein SCO1